MPSQRSDETLAHYGDLRGLATDNGAAVFRTAVAVRQHEMLLELGH